MKPGGTVACWGDDAYGQSDPPAGTFASVSAGGSHTCGLKSDGKVACWGDDSYGQSEPPGGTFSSAEAGAVFSAGIQNGAFVFWGFLG